MAHVVLDQQSVAQLVCLTEQVEIRDQHGKVLGLFVPSWIGEGDLEHPVSDEELDAIEREGGGRLLKDILSDLRKRT